MEDEVRRLPPPGGPIIAGGHRGAPGAGRRIAIRSARMYRRGMEPFVSVLVPVRNEERYIERCLYSIAAQEYPRDRLEVIVIDGMSDDATRAIVGRFAAESTLSLLLVENPRRKPAPAMNAGLAHARGEIIARVDGHAALAPDYIRRCVHALEESAADCAGGALQSEGDTYAGRGIALAMASRFGVGDAAFRTGGEGGEVDTVAFGAYRREVFGRIGGFAEDIDRGEDDEFNYRLRDAGGIILLVPEAHASYTVRGDFGGLARQYFGYGRAKPEVLRRHPAQARWRQFVPATFVAALGFTALRALDGQPRPLRALLALYTLVATIATASAIRGRGWRYLPPVAAAFACLHVSYGAGFIAGTLGLAGGPAADPARPGAHQSTEAPG